MPNKNEVSALKEAVAGIISDRLVEQLRDAEDLPAGDWDTTLVGTDAETGDKVVSLVALAPGARNRHDGRTVLRITIEEV